MKQGQLFHPWPVKVTPLDPEGNVAGDTKVIWVGEMDPITALVNLDDIIWSADQVTTTFNTIRWNCKVSEDVMRILTGHKPLNRKIWKQISIRRLARQRRK